MIIINCNNITREIVILYNSWSIYLFFFYTVFTSLKVLRSIKKKSLFFISFQVDYILSFSFRTTIQDIEICFSIYLLVYIDRYILIKKLKLEIID